MFPNHFGFLPSAKMARLKQAKEEAEKEIAAYRAQVELEFQKKLAEVSIGGFSPFMKN